MRRHLPLIIILILAAILRLLALGEIPSGFSPDEAGQAYSAYSLLKTGRDEWGVAWPISSFRSFLDYKAPLQTYLMIPSIAVFGLNEFAARLPSAIFGILAVAVVYLLANQLFPGKKAGFWAALFLAISPWHFQFSRTAIEVNITSLLFPLGLLFFLKGSKKSRYYYLAIAAWGINLYSYHAAKFFEPIFIFFLIFFRRRAFIKLPKREIVKLVIFGAALVSPLVYDSAFGAGNARAGDLLITNISRQGVARISDLQYYSPLRNISPFLPRLFANKATYMVEQFAGNYLSYLSPAFWFIEGGREITYSVLPGTGLLYIFLLPLVVYGLYRLVKDKDPALPILLIWLLAGILPAALTKEGYRPNRAGSLLTFWELLAAYGGVLLYQTFALFRKAAIPLSAVCLILVLGYFNTYFFEYQTRFPGALSYGYRDLFTKLSAVTGPVIVDKGSNSQAFLSFYQKIDPIKFQAAARDWEDAVKQINPLYLDMLEGYQLENYTFKTFNPSGDLLPGNIVAIPANKYSESYAPLLKDKVDYPTGGAAFYILEKTDE